MLVIKFKLMVCPNLKSEHKHWTKKIGKHLLVLILMLIIIPLAAAVLTLSADKDEYVPGDTLVVSGIATSDSAVAIQVYNPAGSRVAFGQVSTDSDGAFNVSVLVWPPAATVSMPFGTYRISASDASNDDITEITVEFMESESTVTITVTMNSTITVTSTITNNVTVMTTNTVTSTQLNNITSTTTNTVTSTTTLPQVTTTLTSTRTLPQLTTMLTSTTTATTTITETIAFDATKTITDDNNETPFISGESLIIVVAIIILASIGIAIINTR